MYEEIKGKKLLVLAATPLMCNAIKKAQEMGLYVIATDYNTDYSKSPGKLIADECWDISWNDTDALEEKCRECGVDGVFTAFSEFCVMAARRLCDRLGFPFYATEEQIEITRDKVKFKECCQKYGVPVTERFQVSQEPTEEELSKIEFPVIIKPCDNAGSRGISVCYNADELRAGIARALPFSAAGQFVVERYLTGQEVNITYTIQDGNVSLSSMSDAQAGSMQENHLKLSNGWLFPSRHLKEYVHSCDEMVKNMFRGLGLQNGTIFITGFFCDGQFYIFESGYRIGGGTVYTFIEELNGINFMEMMIMHSMTGRMIGGDVMKSDDPFFGKYCCNLAVIARPGVIGSAAGEKEILAINGVRGVTFYYRVGQAVPDSKDMSQTYARVNIVADSPGELADIIYKVYDVVEVRDANGENMMLSRLDHDFVSNYWERC